jgi:protein disulfide-isomerase A1
MVQRRELWLFLALFMSQALLVSCTSEIVKQDGILVLTPQNFNTAYRDNKQLLIEYYAPWCAHCQHFEPQYRSLVKILKRLVPGIELAKMDCEAHKDFCDNQGHTSFPVIIYYDHGTENKFKGRAALNDVIAWIEKVDQPVEVIDSYARLHHRRKVNEHSIVLVADRNSPKVKTFLEIAESIPDFKWFHYVEENNGNLPLTPPRVLIKNADSDVVLLLDQYPTKEALQAKIDIHRYPKEKKYEDKNIAEMIFERNKPALLFVVDNNATYAQYKPLLSQVNEEFLETAPVVAFIKENVGKQADRFLNYFGIKTFPFLIYMKQIEMGKMTKHFFKGALNAEEIKTFAKAAIAGKLKQDYKSQPKPKDTGAAVKELVGEDFQDFVNDEHDTIVTYYVPDCTFCDQFKPTFEEVAEEYKKAGKKLVFARIDVQNNECGFNYMGYPQIKLHKKGNYKNPESFDERDRTKAQLLTFLSKNGFKLVEDKKPEPPKQEVKTPEPPKQETKQAEQPKQTQEPPKQQAKTPEPPKAEQPKQTPPPPKQEVKTPEPPKQETKQAEQPKQAQEPPKQEAKTPEQPKQTPPPPKQEVKTPEPPKQETKQPEPPKQQAAPPKQEAKTPEPPKQAQEPPKQQAKTPEPPKGTQQTAGQEKQKTA